jgi:hypothetical protein
MHIYISYTILTNIFTHTSLIYLYSPAGKKQKHLYTALGCISNLRPHAQNPSATNVWACRVSVPTRPLQPFPLAD